MKHSRCCPKLPATFRAEFRGTTTPPGGGGGGGWGGDTRGGAYGRCVFSSARLAGRIREWGTMNNAYSASYAGGPHLVPP